MKSVLIAIALTVSFSHSFAQTNMKRQIIPGTFEMVADPTTPASIAFPSNMTGAANFTFSVIRFTNTSLQPLCIDGFQLGTLTSPVGKVENVRLYVGKNLIGSANSDAFYNVENTTYASWIFTDIEVPGKSSILLTITADVPPSARIKSGLFSLGFSGINFAQPGAMGSAISFGNVMALN